MNNWVQTAKGIANGDVEISYNNPNAFPIFITKQFGVLCGDNGNSHASTTGNDKKKMAVIKAVKLLKNNPNLFDTLFPDKADETFSSNFSKAVLVADKIVADINWEGRCYDIRDEYNVVVFTFWSYSVNVEDAVSEVCREMGYDEKDAVVAEPDDDDENDDYMEFFTPDYIVIGGKKIRYNSNRATPFSVLYNPFKKSINVEFGENGSKHSSIEKYVNDSLSKIGGDKEYTYDMLKVVEGRFWRLEDSFDAVVFSFWALSPYMSKRINIDEKKIMKYISDKFGIDYSKVYYTHLNSLVKADTDKEVKFNNQEKLDKMRAIHLMGQKEKRDALADFRKTRDANWDETHKNDDGSVPTRAEYNAKFPFMENKEE